MSALKEFIKEKKELFWSVGPSHIGKVSDELLVEVILNYGTLEDVKKLFEHLGLEKTADIFFKATKGKKRHNYFPPVENFFRLYFNRHVR